jgi:hypothetical protein
LSAQIRSAKLNQEYCVNHLNQQSLSAQQKLVQAYITAPIAAPTSDRIFEKEQPLEVHQPKPGATQLGRRTLTAFHKTPAKLSPPRNAAGNGESPFAPLWFRDSRLEVWNHPLPVSGN